jgi:hypothetical protein
MLLAGALLLAALATPAADTPPASDVSALFNRFGLFGEWAVACKAQASPKNPHVTVSEPEPGRVVERHDLGSRYGANTYRMLDAHRISPTRIAIEAEFQPRTEAEQKQDLVFSVHDRTRRTLFVQTAGGAVRVKDGVVVGYGVRTPRLRKCE